MKRLANVTLLVCLAMQVGCAGRAVVALTDKGTMVEQTIEERVVSCEFIGNVEAASPNNDGSPGYRGKYASARAVQISILNQAGERGATHVIFTQAPVARFSGSSAFAKAYRCPARPVAGATK